MGEPPSRNVTVPVGVPVPGKTGLTVAVKVTNWPETEGLTDDVTAVVVPALLMSTTGEVAKVTRLPLADDSSDAENVDVVGAEGALAPGPDDAVEP
jgi:hypothetical protein